MRMLRYSLAAFFLCLASPAFAINCAVANGACFWIGGTGTMDFATDSAHWSNSSGGATCSCEPISSNSLTFDGSSGGGTVTSAATVNATSLTFGAFTGTLDFSVNNNNVNIVNPGGTSLFSGTGTGARKLLMGTGTWTVGSNSAGSSVFWNFLTTTNLDPTSNLTSANIVLVSGAAGSSGLFFGGKTWGPLTINGSSTYSPAKIQFESGTPVNDTFSSLTINAPAWISFNTGQTFTFTNGITVSGASWSAPVYIESNNASSGGTVNLAVGAASNCNYASFRNVVGQTNTITANPGVNFGGNGGTLAITNPGTGGGGGFIIGGG